MSNLIVVDFKFKNKKGVLKDCVVYNGVDKEPIQDIHKLREVIENEEINFDFQNASIHGNTNINNIDKYSVRVILDSEF